MRKGLIRSPYTPKKKEALPSIPFIPSVFDSVGGFVQLNEILNRLNAKEQELDARLEEADSLLELADRKAKAAGAEIERVSSIHDTIRYIQGKNGRDGAPGRDGKDADEEAVARRAATFIDYKNIVSSVRKLIKVKDGKDAAVDYGKVLADLKSNLTLDDIPGLRGEIDSYRNQLAGKHYGKDTWARGGGDTVEEGAGITITPTADGRKRISATGSGGITIETPTGTVNAVNTTFTPTKEPLYAVADGIQYFESAGYTWDGTRIVFDVPPSQYVRDAISS